MIHIQIKHDTQHRHWKQLAVELSDRCPEGTIQQCCIEHLYQYAVDNQMNVSLLSARAVDVRGKVIYTRLSDAITNRPTKE